MKPFFGCSGLECWLQRNKEWKEFFRWFVASLRWSVSIVVTTSIFTHGILLSFASYHLPRPSWVPCNLQFQPREWVLRKISTQKTQLENICLSNLIHLMLLLLLFSTQKLQYLHYTVNNFRNDCFKLQLKLTWKEFTIKFTIYHCKFTVCFFICAMYYTDLY